MHGDEAIDVVRRAYEANARHDVEGMLALFLDDIEIVEPESLPYGGIYHGKTAVYRLREGLMAAWSGFVCEVLEYTVRDDVVVAIIAVDAVARKSGRPIVLRIAERWEVLNGRVKRITPFYFDTHAVRQALA